MYYYNTVTPPINRNDMTVDTKVTKKFIFLLPKQKYFALALQVKRKVQGVYDFAQINCKQIIKVSN